MPKLTKEQRAAKDQARSAAAGETGEPIPYQRYTHSFSGWTGYWRILAEQAGWTPLHRSVHCDILRFGMAIAVLFWQADLRPNPDTPDDTLAQAVFMIADQPGLAPFTVLDPNDVEQLLRLKEDLHGTAMDRDLEAFCAQERNSFNENQ